MPTVTANIKRLLKEKDQQIISGAAAIKGILSDLRQQILDELRAVSGESYSVVTLKQNLASIERHLQSFESAAQRELGSQLSLVWERGEDLLQDATTGSGLYFGFGNIPTAQLDALKEFSFSKIKSVTSAAWDKIRGELTMGVLGQRTPHQVTQAIAGSLDGPGVFKSVELRAETITKLEMGRSYSTATHLSIAQAAESVPELQKEWWHAGHPKQPRINHVRLHGQRKPVYQPFLLGGLIIRYPRDPKAPLKEVINCGCEVVPWHPAWGKESLPKPGLQNNRSLLTKQT